MIRAARLVVAPCAAFALFACGDADDVDATASQEPTAAEEAVVETNPDYDPDAAGAGNEYSYATLLALRDDDPMVIPKLMQNVGGCRFLEQDGEVLLSVGRPDNRSAPGVGVARPNGLGRVRLDALQPGEQFIDNGPRLAVIDPENTLPDLEVSIAREPGEGEKVGVETMQWPATLTVSAPEGTGPEIAGTWSCGV